MAEAGPDPDDECLGPSEAERANLVVVLYGKAEDIPAELERLEADAKMALHGQTLEGTTGPLEHVSTIPYYQEEANPDRGMVEVTFRFSFYWTAAAP
jgi:hypothetical protein